MLAAAELIAANPGPGMHIALLGVVVVVGLIVFAFVRTRRKREAEQAESLDHSHESRQHHSPHAGGRDHSGHPH